MNKDIYFMPLGGGQTVGASCYFLRLGEVNIILDAGIGFKRNIVYSPNTYSLKTSSFIESISQINQIYISHAHIDHSGYMLKLMNECKYANIYMTDITASLTEYQLYDKQYLSGKAEAENDRLAVMSMFDKVIKVGYMKPLNFGKYRVNFFPAGHIPGAMMTLFEYGNRKILYTGDFSTTDTLLTGGCIIPQGLNIDTVIMCALHAKHPRYIHKSNGLNKLIGYIYQKTQKGRSVRCRVKQLSKGVEFIKALNEANEDKVPIYIDKSLMPVITKLEQLSIGILDENNYCDNLDKAMKPHIYVTADKVMDKKRIYDDVSPIFSLHEDFSEMQSFIKRINPKYNYLVHCSGEHSASEDTIEQAIMADGDCRTQFIFAKEGEIYKL